MFVAAVLALLIGVVLGMLGGGGAILTLPMLVYVAGVEPRAAIAMSLFVVGSTSLVGTAVHARAERVRWKVGALFGVAAMAGAFAGGRAAHFVAAPALLSAFAVVMLVTATAMLRQRSAMVEAARPLAAVRVLVLGAAVGVVSGLVGAGGGFLIVPALTIFGGLSMRDAVGTSLLVIALQSFAGLAGHIGYVELDWSLATTVTGAAVIGAVTGAWFGKNVAADALRRGFAWLVLAMGAFVLWKQLPAIPTPRVHDFTPLSALIGGALIGLAASVFLLTHGRVAGISGLFGGLLRRGADARVTRLAFLAGLAAGGLVLRLAYPTALESSWAASLPVALVAGVLVGFGTQLGGGCTSGHGVCGLSRLSSRSLVATCTFMLTGFVTTFVVRHLLGGAAQ